MSANSLCFKEAYDARTNGEIEQEEFMRHNVNHYSGLRHEEDAEGKRPYFRQSSRPSQRFGAQRHVSTT
jgi:hypothetical protein